MNLNEAIKSDIRKDDAKRACAIIRLEMGKIEKVVDGMSEVNHFDTYASVCETHRKLAICLAYLTRANCALKEINYGVKHYIAWPH